MKTPAPHIPLPLPTLLAMAAAGLLSSATSFAVGPEPATAAPAMPPAAPSDHTTWTAYATQIEALASTGGGGYSYDLHRSGGTSVYLKLVHEGITIGAILPENSATSIEGETTSWNVARMLGFPKLSQPAAPITLKGRALASFRDQLASSSFRGQKEQNRKNVLQRIDANPDGIPVVFKQWLPIRPVGLDSLVNPGLSPNGRLRSDTALARFLRHDKPMPGLEPMSLKEVRDATAPEVELARQLSNILLADALVGQWDRFSGGNIHAYVLEGKLQLASLDNGGATVTSGNGFLTRFEESVTRFDAGTVDHLRAMRAFLKGEAAEFAGHTEVPAFLSALGFKERNHERFVARIHRVADHVEACVQREGGVFP